MVRFQGVGVGLVGIRGETAHRTVLPPNEPGRGSVLRLQFIKVIAECQKRQKRRHNQGLITIAIGGEDSPSEITCKQKPNEITYYGH